MLGHPSSARLAWLAAFLVALPSCDSGEGPAPKPSAAPPAPAPPPEPPPTPSRPTSFSSEDGAALSGDLYAAAPGSPAVVLVHRLFGQRSEYQPLVEKLRRSKKRYSVLNFDLRGHGASKEPAPEAAKSAKKSKTVKPGDSKQELALDVRAAIAHVESEAAGKARSVVLVGSSFGATLAASVTFSAPKVTALALLSPGAAIRGLDLYRPYSEVRNLPTFIAGADDDTVAKDPLDSLARMAQRANVKRYSGARHGAEFLGQEHPELWADLEKWLMEVYDKPPEERRSLYFAPGKEPKAQKRANAPRARGGG